MNIKTTLQELVRKQGYSLRDVSYVPESHERKIYEYYLKGADQIQTIFDVGANIGQTALGFHASFPEATIYSFEPFAETYKILAQNTASLSNIRCQPLALGEADSTMAAVASGESSLTNSLLDVRQNQRKQEDKAVETITVRAGKSFCSEHSIQRIDILKIDVEGYEVPVLKGFGDFLGAGVPAILSEFCLLENRALQTPLTKLQNLLHPRGYELVSFYDIRHEQDGAFHYGNALFIHADHLKTDRRW